MYELEVPKMQFNIIDDNDIKLYIDSLMLSPRDYRDVELIFVLQRNG